MHKFLPNIILLIFCKSAFAVQQGNDIGHFWQLTDVHFDPDYSVQGDPHNHCHRSNTSQHNIGYYGDYQCDAPWALVQSAVEEMQKLESNPDFILWTGDTVPHIDQKSVSDVYKLLHNVSTLLSQTFPKTTILPVLGNHDAFPANQMPLADKSNDYYNNILTKVGWSKFLTQDEQQKFLSGGYYSKDINVHLRLLLLNSNVWYLTDKMVAGDPDPNKQFAWLKEQLSIAQKQKIKVFIGSHICPGSFERVERMMFYYPEFNKRYLSLMREFSSTVAAHFCGHEHTDSFRLLRDTDDHPSSMMFLSPAVTPWRSSIPGIGANNPSVRLYHYSRSTGNIVDYFQYYLNLTLANQQPKNNPWQLEYQATKSYNLSNCSVSNFQHLTSSWDKNSPMFQKYLQYNSVCYNMSLACDQRCYLTQTCAILNLDVNDYNHCLFMNGKTTLTPDTTSHHPHRPHRRLPRYMYYVIGAMALLIVILTIVVSCLCAKQHRYGVGFKYGHLVAPIN